ncbi:MAG: peptidyl-prolyl cis-trans isomerase [Candidatus Sulfotelmatobacter sp.]
MRKSWLMCVLLGTLAWGQATPGNPPPAQPAQVPADTSATVPPEAAVITVNGVCPAQPKAAAMGTAAKPATDAQAPAAKTPPADCKTVITKAEFEKLANGVAPSVTPQLKKQLASVLPRLIAMSNAAREQGLDKTPQFQETLKFAEMQILTNELQRNIQEEAGKVPQQDIEQYYKENAAAFEQFNLDRLFVPRTKQGEDDAKDEEDEKDEKLSDEAKKAKGAREKAKADEAVQAMAKLAETLRARAAAGEDFAKLQKEAFEAAGMKIESPTVNLPSVRRTGLPTAHAGVFDLKPGDVSQVISDSGGHYVYKVNSKTEMTLDQATSEIHSKLQNDRTREMMDKVNGSFKVETNEMYFGPGGASAPPPRLPHPRPGPSTAPAAQPQTPPSAQPPAPKPN